MHKIRAFFQPKVLRLIALGLTLLSCLLLLIQANYGSQRLVALGHLSGNGASKSIEVEILAAHPAESAKRITVDASRLLIRSIGKYDSDTEFLVVVNERKQKFFERIYVLTKPEGGHLQGPRFDSGKQLVFAVGTKPELVAMVGLDRFGYNLSQPIWVKQKMPEADMVFCQTGTLDGVKEIMDGNSQDFSPDVFYLDSQDRVVGIRKISGRIVTFPEFMRLAAICLFCAAFLAAAGSLIAYKWSTLAKAGSRIWDQVSMRGRKSSN